MIRVIIEVVPHGYEEHMVALGTLEIFNTSAGDDGVGDYKYKNTTASGEETGTIRGFQRRTLTAYDLIKDVFVDLQKDRG